MATVDDLQRLEIRVGRIVEVDDLPGTRKPFYKLTIDFGPSGVKGSAAQLTHYPKEELKGRLIVGVINLPPRKVAGFPSEVLVLGLPDEEGKCVLLSPDRDVPLGGSVY